MHSVVFEKSYVNHAWGYQHRGSLITDDGFIWKYDLSGQRRDTPYTPEEKLYRAIRVGQVPYQAMNDLLDLLDCIPHEPLPEKQHTAYDAGSNSLKAYRDGEMVVLDLRGDYSATSSDKCIKELVSKLQKYMSF